MFLDHTRRSTVGRTPLDEWSARRRDLYLTTHDTHNRQISMPPVGFEPKIPPGAWIFVCCECRVSSGRGLCDELITRPEESYRLCCVVCDLETSRIGAPYIYDISSLRVKRFIYTYATELEICKYVSHTHTHTHTDSEKGGVVFSLDRAPQDCNIVNVTTTQIISTLTNKCTL